LLSVSEICDLAVNRGAFAVGMVDVNSFAGLPELLSQCERRGLKAVVGTEILLDKRHLMTLYCLNREGFSRANRLLTAMALADSADAPGIRGLFDPVSFLLEQGCSGLAVVAMESRTVKRLYDSPSFSPGGGALLFQGLVWGRPFRTALRESRSMGVPVIALNRAILRGPQDLTLYQVLRAIGRRQLFDRLDPPVRYRRDMGIASTGEMASFFSACPEALEAGYHLALTAEPFSFPAAPVFPPFQGLNREEADQRLSTLSREGLLRRYGARPGAAAWKRLDYELSIIREKRFSTIFLIVHDLVLRHPRTCGRGSAAASIVSYSLGITHVDPLAYDLYFERFLNRGREDPPDIDVDFPWDERERALDYLFESYPEQAALVADHVTFGPRASIREVLRVMATDPEEMERISSLWKKEDRKRIPDALAALIEPLNGMPRHFGTHPGGVVITPGPLTDYVHWFRSPLGRPVIAWEKEGAEAMGLVKIDFLGNRSLAVLRDVIELVNPLRKTEGEEEISWETFSPLDDRATEEMIRTGDTLGVFYVESPATRQLLKKMGRGDYLHLVAASSIIRPAANRQAETYIRRLRGEPWSGYSKETGKILQENLGILIYQEDVSRVAVAAAGFDEVEADRLRKVLSKKDRELHIPAFRERFFSGGRAKGMPEKELESLWEGICSFQGYSFCKAHSASYALVSYRLAWMKRHYPLRFFLGVLNNRGGFYSPQVYLNAVRRAGFGIAAPHINRSASQFTLLEGGEEGETLLGGFSLIRGVSATVESAILESRREAGPFTSFTDFMDRIAPDALSLRGLIRSGALDCLSSGAGSDPGSDPASDYGTGRPSLFWEAALWKREGREGSLFPTPPPPPSLGDYPRQVKMEDELHFLGLFFSCHPLVPFLSRAAGLLEGFSTAQKGESLLFVSSRTMDGAEGCRAALSGYLTAGKELLTKNKQEMAFLSFEDPEGFFEAVLFPQIYHRLGRDLGGGEFFLLIGTVRREWEAFHLEIEALYPLFRRKSFFSQSKVYLPGADN